MLRALLSQQSDNGFKWLFSHLMETLKADSGKRQGYGYTVLSRDVGYTKGISQGYLELSDWVNGFIVSPKNDCLLPNVASALSGRLKAISKPRLTELGASIELETLRNLFEQKMTSYWLFEPLVLLIDQALQEHGIEYERVKKHPSFIGEYLGEPRKIAAPTVIRTENALICWRSAYDLGRHHKAKELMGRAQAMRFEYKRKTFARRSDVDSMILVVDGTFETKQLKSMYGAGWDYVLYADDLDDLGKILK